MVLKFKFKGYRSWPLIRAHLCTLAIAVSFNATWKVPREGFRFGGLSYALVLTAAMLIVALPITLLQLAVGQLSQQDAVGVWKAVPFFKGVGYVRVLASYLAAAYTMVYLSLTVAYFLYTCFHGIPFEDCTALVIDAGEESPENRINATECLSNTFMSPVTESVEYYLSIAFIAIFLWIIAPFVFYNPVKLMKRLMYTLAPVVTILGLVIVCSIGNGMYLSSINNSDDWTKLVQSDIWFSGIVQALWSCQISGGYLISAGDSIYSTTNVLWSSVIITGVNLVSSWFWMIFWFAVSAGEKDTSTAAVLVQMYQSSEEQSLSIAWPIIVYITLAFSGIITMLTLLYPVFDRIRRVGGVKWRLATFGSSLAGAGISLAILAGGLPYFSLLEDVALPLLISISTIMELPPLVFIYGWRNLVEDVEFLISNELKKYWVWGWWIAPIVVKGFVTWWLGQIFLDSFEPTLEVVTVIATAVVAVVIVLLCAGVVIGRQVQYDICGKLKSSFKPSRHWGPRDPITHYYWLARREDILRGNVPRTRYNRRELGQLSTRPSFLTVSSISKELRPDAKNRSNSDDWLYTSGRKERFIELYNQVKDKKRSKSLDWDVPFSPYLDPSRFYKKSLTVSEGNSNGIIGFKFYKNVDAQ